VFSLLFVRFLNISSSSSLDVVKQLVDTLNKYTGNSIVCYSIIWEIVCFNPGVCNLVSRYDDIYFRSSRTYDTPSHLNSHSLQDFSFFSLDRTLFCFVICVFFSCFLFFSIFEWEGTRCFLETLSVQRHLTTRRARGTTITTTENKTINSKGIKRPKLSL